ncbi:hypothetical protein RJ55_04384 [Drechmeria coniospora]|nr:hypothetical protein RJ55_04384 [Drechmeria coniospora]
MHPKQDTAEARQIFEKYSAGVWQQKGISHNTPTSRRGQTSLKRVATDSAAPKQTARRTSKSRFLAIFGRKNDRLQNPSITSDTVAAGYAARIDLPLVGTDSPCRQSPTNRGVGLDEDVRPVHEREAGSCIHARDNDNRLPIHYPLPLINQAAVNGAVSMSQLPNEPTSSKAPAAKSSPQCTQAARIQGLSPALCTPLSDVQSSDSLAEGASVETERSIICREKHYDSRVLDAAAFDSALYRQHGVRKPTCVSISTSQQLSVPSSSEDRMYAHANPFIHLTHNRSEEWYEAKSQEIRSRGRRKDWFGKVVERQRWLHKKRQSASCKGDYSLRLEPQPWTFNRPLDFGDVPQSELPDMVQQNPAWLEACAWFRENEQIRHLRHVEAKKSEQETKEFYEVIMNQMNSGA